MDSSDRCYYNLWVSVLVAATFAAGIAAADLCGLASTCGFTEQVRARVRRRWRRVRARPGAQLVRTRSHPVVSTAGA